MNNDETKKENSMIAKIIGVIGVIALIAYNGWVVYNNHFGRGSVIGTVKELLAENIPNCINEEVVRFVELDDVKLEGIADNKWDGEASVKLKAKETGKVAPGRFTFGVEKKGSMIYLNDLKLDEESIKELLVGEVSDVTNEETPKELSVGEASDATDEESLKGTNKPKVTDWASYVKKLNADANKMTTIQKKELHEAEKGRLVEIDVVVDDVQESSEDGTTYYVISSHLESQGQDRRTIQINVFNFDNSCDAFEISKKLTKNAKICVVGAVFFLDSPLFPLDDDPRIACFQIKRSVIGEVSDTTNEESPKDANKPMDLKSEVQNASDLVSWIKVREDQTEIQRNDTFSKFKGKMVVFRGEVREVGKTVFGGRLFVSLTVGELNEFENINIQFNFKNSQETMVAAWGKGETHVLRGRINGRGDMFDDVSCDTVEIVQEEKYHELWVQGGSDFPDNKEKKSETANLFVPMDSKLQSEIQMIRDVNKALKASDRGGEKRRLRDLHVN